MLYQNIDDFINYNNDHLVSFTVSTYNNLNLINNLFTSAKNNNINLVLFALDRNIANFILNNFDCDVVLFILNTDENKNNIYSYKYGTKEWCSIVYDRYFITHRLLKDGRNIVYMDTDVIINRNYLNDLKEKLRDNDILIQTNGNDCCTGFFAMKSCRKLINFFNRKNMIQNLNCYSFGGKGGPSDQKFFNHYIGKNKQEFNYAFLERNLYPNGNHYYDNYEFIDEYCYIIHFNCCKTEYKKILRLIYYKKILVNNLLDYMSDNSENNEDDKVLLYKELIDLYNNKKNIDFLKLIEDD